MRANWPAAEVQLCTLLSIKTGGCSEDCSYCAQSARYSTGVDAERLLEKETVMEKARQARETGSTRFCMGAAWKGVRDGTKRFDQVLDIIRDVSTLGMEVCVTLGELGATEAQKLREAGVTAYNHNIDTSPEHYGNIVSTHTFQDRLEYDPPRPGRRDERLLAEEFWDSGKPPTIASACSRSLSEFNPQPESVPDQQPHADARHSLSGSAPVDVFDLVRMIATTRIAVPGAKVRLSAGRTHLNDEAQALCFFAGANSIFYGDKLLTAGNPATEQDLTLMRKLGLAPQAPDPSLMPPSACAKRELEPAVV